MFTLKIKTDNAAFEEGAKGLECASILRVVADRLLNGSTYGKVKDSNGNTVGEFKLT